jgi:hypothetical protein
MGYRVKQRIGGRTNLSPILILHSMILILYRSDALADSSEARHGNDLILKQYQDGDYRYWTTEICSNNLEPVFYSTGNLHG